MKKCVMAIREIWKIRCVVYLDYLLFLHPDKNHLAKLTLQISQFFQHYGWTVNLEKSHFQPTQQFQYLGWIWDSTTMTVQLPKDRHLRILKELRTVKKRIYKKKMASVRILAILIWIVLRYCISRAPMVEQYNNGEQSSLNHKRPSSASSDYNGCSPRSMGSNSSDGEERQILQSGKGSKEINLNGNSPINNH
jgi:hypothetical protein